MNGKRMIIIGLGSMGKRRIRLLKELYPDNEYIGLDSNEKRADEVQKQLGIPVIDSLEALEGNVFAAFVCTSPKSHAHLITECLSRGMHVFTEINLIADGYLINIELARKGNRTLFLSSTQLYKAEIQYIADRVKMFSGNMIYSYHVGQYLPDWHPWDNLKDFFVSSKETNGCRELMAIEFPWLLKTFGKVQKMSVHSRDITCLDLSFPDTYVIELFHENGTIGRLLIDIASRQPVRHFELMGRDLYILWEGTPDTLFEHDLVTHQLKQVLVGEYIHNDQYGSFINEAAYMEEIKDFFNVIRGEQPRYTFQDDEEILTLIDKVEQGI